MSAGRQQPTSFKTNVNRAKTKRWIEAKSYSYDGDDWGDADEYDEYGGYDEPPKPTGFRQQGQSAGPVTQSPYTSPTAPQQKWSENTRPGYGNVAGQAQQHHGFRSTTNPQPRVTTDHGRSNSFDRGDEKRGFSAGGYQQDLTGLGGATYQQPYNTSNIQSPTQFSPNQMRQPQRPTPQQRDPSFSEPGNIYSQPANYRGAPPYDEPRQLSMGSRAQSMTSNTSSLDIHNRRDFTPSALPQPLQSQSSPPRDSVPSSQRPPRSSSLSQTNQPPVPNPAQIPTTEAFWDAEPTQRERTSSNADKPLPFVRPAEIYRRMQEDKERERQSQDSLRPSLDAINTRADYYESSFGPALHEEQPVQPGPATSDSQSHVGDRKQTGGFNQTSQQAPYSIPEGKGDRERDAVSSSQQQPVMSSVTTSVSRNPQAPSSSQQGPLLPLLPEVARFSSFGESFLGTDSQGDEVKPNSGLLPTDQTQPSAASATTSDNTTTDLQHQPSSGFRSVVNQAFDVTEDQIPPTPSTTAGSGIERSTSGGTSVISPIISRGPSTSRPDQDSKDIDKRTLTSPVIEEVESSTSRPMSSESIGTPKQGTQITARPGETPTDENQPRPGSFIPGHRRDLSTPSPDNSPARTPALESNRQLRQPQEAEFAVATPTTTDFGPRTSPTTEQAGRIRSDSRFAIDARSQSKVRNLAGKFESASSSRRGSDQSPTRRTGQLKTTSQDNESAAPNRPLGDRMESFRPHLPGAWDSYISNAPSTTSNKSLDDERAALDNHQDKVQAISRPSYDAVAISRQASPDTPTQAKRTEEKQEPQNDPFSSVKAAGSALAGAFAAATGSDQLASSQAAGTETDSAIDTHDKQMSRPRSRSTSINTTIQPEADRSPLPMVRDEDDESRVAPTPPLKKLQPPSEGKGSSEYSQTADAANAPGYGLGRQQATPLSRPPMPPSLSTDAGSQYESDRLRREIMRDLTPNVPSEPTTAESDSPYQDEPRLPASHASQGHGAARESMVIPREYDSYWNGAASQSSSRSSSIDGRGSAPIGSREVPTAAIMTENHSTQPPNDSQKDTAPFTEEPHGTRPSLVPHRFSWEIPSQTSTEAIQKSLLSSPSLQNSYAQANESSQLTDGDRTGRAMRQRDLPDSPTVGNLLEKERADVHKQEPWGFQTTSNSHIPPLPPSPVRQAGAFLSEKQSFQELSKTHDHLEATANPEAVSENEPETSSEQPILASIEIPKHGALDSSVPPPSSLNSAQPKIPAFREILAMKPAEERIRGFNEAREQYARSESGLSNWLTVKISELPEHADVLANVGRPPAAIMGHKPSSSRLLSGLRSTGSQQQSTSDTNNNISQGPSPSGGGGKMSSQQVQAKGKDLLHSAGVFGGKANVAAKGLFSKGRSRLKEARGSDKDTTLSSGPASMPQGIQPHIQPPYTPSTSNVSSEPQLGTSMAPSSQLGHSINSDRFDPNQKAAQAKSLDANDDSFHNRHGHSIPTAQDVQNHHSPGLANLQSSRHNAPQARSHEPIAPDDINPCEHLSFPSEGFPEADADVEDSQQAHTARSSGPGTQMPTQTEIVETNGNRLPHNTQNSVTRETGHDDRTTHIDPSKSSIDNATVLISKQLSIPRPRFTSLELDTKDAAANLNSGRPTSPKVSIDRNSEDSNGIFHTVENGYRSRPGSGSAEEPLETPRAERSPMFSRESSVVASNENRAAHPALQPTVDASTSQLKNAAQKQTTEPTSEQFTQVDQGHSEPPPTRQDYLAREPSLDNIVGQVESDRSASPVSPQHSVHNEPVPQQSTREPIYYGSQHDFGVKQTHSLALRSPSSSSQPSEDPGPHRHPAIRSQPHTDVQHHVSPSKHSDSITQGKRTSGRYSEENRSSPARTAEGKFRSDRSSRNSGFFKNLGGSGKVGVPSIVSAAEIQPPPSSAMSPTESEQKSKRGSVIRSRKGDKSDDDSRGIAGSPNTGSPAPSTARSSQLDDSLNHGSKTSRNEFQRASTSENKVSESGGKKKRFSAIGSLFGKRTSRTQPSPAIQPRSAQPEATYNPSQTQQPHYQVPFSMHRTPADQSRHPPVTRQSQEHIDTSGPHQADRSFPSRIDTMTSQTSTPVWSRAAQRVSQTRQSSFKEPSAYVQDSALRQQVTSPPATVAQGPVRRSTSSSQKTPSDAPTSKLRTSLFSRSKSRESSNTGRNRKSSGKSGIANREQVRIDSQSSSSNRQSQTASSTPSVRSSTQANAHQITQNPQRVLTFNQFGESHITSPRAQEQQTSQSRASNQGSNPASDLRPQRTTSLGNDTLPKGPPRILTFSQFGENRIEESPSPNLPSQALIQDPAGQAQHPNVLTFQAFPSDPKSQQPSRRDSPLPPPPPPKDDWHVSKPRGSVSQNTRRDNTRQQHADTLYQTPAAPPPSHPDSQRTSHSKPLAESQQRQAPPPIQTEIPSFRLSAFGSSNTSAESRKARQRELESATPSAGNEMALAPAPASAKNDASSEENIVMSSSSYPGQEWQPSFAYDD